MKIRYMAQSDLALVLDWAAAEGWNPGLDDAPAFLAIDPQGFLIGEIDGAPAVAISSARHGPVADKTSRPHARGVAFIGLYIARPDLRGRGHGLALWTAAMARLDGRAPRREGGSIKVDTYAVGLDGVPAQQENYRRSGFVYAHRNARWSGAPDLPPTALTPLSEVSRIDLLEYDAKIAGYLRPRFLRAWTAPSPARHGAALLRDGALAGYGVVRDCRSGAKIGPLFADDEAAAETLFAALATLTPARPLILDAPDPNAAAAALATRLGLTPDFETARMWRGAPPPEDLARTFGVATFELG